MNTWNEMLRKAKEVQNSRKISPFIDAGGVAAAILTEKGNIYVGVCIDASSSLGMCAERNAIANMITNGESRIKKVLAIMSSGKVGLPCGACRELLMQLDKSSEDIEILMDYDSLKATTLGELCPSWWTESKFNEIASMK
jgi:cytidine deaminase